MARPVGEELARNPTAISRPKGGWFARIWTQRAGSAAGDLTVEKIRLERADPFTLWITPRTESRPGPRPGSAITSIPSRAFTLWATQQAPANVSAETPIDGTVVDQVIAPLPAGVFDEPVLSEEHHEELQTVQSSGDPAAILLSGAFTVWTTAEALASPAILTVSAGQVQPPGDTRGNEAEQSPPANSDVANLELPLIRIARCSAFTLWGNDAEGSSETLQGLALTGGNDFTAGDAGQGVPGSPPVVLDTPGHSPMGGTARLVALAALILLLIAAMFVITAKNKQIGDLNLGAGVAKGKINELKHDKQDLKGLLGDQQVKGAVLAKEHATLKSDFAAAKEQYAKASADLQARGDQLALNLKEIRSMLEGSKRDLARGKADREQIDLNYRKARSGLEAQLVKTEAVQKELEIQRKVLSDLGASMEQQKKTAAAAAADARLKMAAADKALEDAGAQMASRKMQLEQSEKKAALLAAEVKKLKAVIDDLKIKPAQPPESKPDPQENPVPEVEPKAAPKDKPDEGPINV
ncbi:MAG: hypothetical protein VCA55_07280 [Verrucomicrobiales bacterium]